MTAAIAVLVAEGLSGPVVLELESTYPSRVETFPLTLGAIPGSDPENTLTIRSTLGATGHRLISFAGQTCRKVRALAALPRWYLEACEPLWMTFFGPCQ